MSANLNDKGNLDCSNVYGVRTRLLQIMVISLFYFSDSGGGKKGAKKKGSSFQTVSALFRVQYIFEFQVMTFAKKLNDFHLTFLK